MTDGDALRAAVAADPDEDLPRLMYADWLDENDQPDRAAFVRAQIEAARQEPFSPAARAAAARAETLLARHRYEWSKHLSYSVEIGFSRGFIERIHVHAARFPHVADAVFSAEPVRMLRIVRPRTREDVAPAALEPVFESPHLARLTRLELPDVGLIPEEADALTDSAFSTGLKELSLRSNPLSPSWAAVVVAGKSFPGLTALDLAGNAHLGTAVTNALTRDAYHRFISLDLSGIAFSSGALKQVLASPALAAVEEMRLGWDYGSDRPGPLTHLDLGWVLPLKILRVLDLAGQGLGPEGVREIGRNPEAATLRWLGLASNGIGSEGVGALIESHLNLYHLDVRGNWLSAKDASALRERFPDAEVIV
jgi:uncharacterized protein (TIGR02996 family)